MNANWIPIVLLLLVILAVMVKGFLFSSDTPRSGASPGSASASPSAQSGPHEVLLQNPGNNKIQVIKIIRQFTHLGLKESKDLVDQAPSVIKQRISAEEAEHLRRELEAVGADAVVR